MTPAPDDRAPNDPAPSDPRSTDPAGDPAGSGSAPSDAQRTGRNQASWRRGPDPDDPPWARERDPATNDADRGDAHDTGDDTGDEAGEEAGDEAEDEAEDGEPDEPGQPGRDASEGGAPSDAADGDEPATSRGHELAEVPRGLLAPRPPRRTGVFVDPEDLREHVGGLLRAVLGGYEVDAFGNFTFTHEGARIFVTVGASPIGPQVGVFSVTNLDLPLTPELASFLLTTNHTLGFGAFSYDTGNRAVWLRHTLLGTTLDLPELQTAVAAISTTAARLVDGIRRRFGGRTFQEAPTDVQRRMEPPEPVHQERSAGASGYL
jgi:hypothetical protein